MSYLQLIHTSIKKTDKKIQSVPARYYFVPTIIIAIAISSFIYLSNPYLYTWTIESLIANIAIVSLVFWVVGVLLLFSLMASILFFSILLQERRREINENARVISTTLRQVVREELEKIFDSKEIKDSGFIKDALSLANESYQKHDESINMLVENDERQDKHLARQNQQIFALKWVLTKVLRKNNKLRQTKKENNQIVSDKSLTQNNTNNTKIKKLRDIDE